MSKRNGHGNGNGNGHDLGPDEEPTEPGHAPVSLLQRDQVRVLRNLSLAANNLGVRLAELSRDAEREGFPSATRRAIGTSLVGFATQMRAAADVVYPEGVGERTHASRRRK